MDEIIKEYLQKHLSINIRETGYGFNGKSIAIELKIDDDVISSDYYDIYNDEG